MTSRSAPDAESLSCAIAARYAGRWARSRARPEGDGLPPAWFIDGFAGADLQRAALRGAAVQPAAVAAIQVLDPATRIVLIEEDPGLISRLCEALDDIGAVERIRVTADPASAEPGEIALVEAPFARVAASVAAGIGDEPALVRLAPLAARALPWGAVEPFLDLGATDVLLRAPLEDFAKQARFTGPLADLPPHIRRVVEGCSALLSDPRHGWISAWREAQRTGGTDAALAVVVERVQALLDGVDEERITYPLPVEGAGGPVHLLLSTPRAEHADELSAAASDGAATRPKRSAATSAPAPAELPAADPPPVEESPAPAEPAPPSDPAAAKPKRASSRKKAAPAEPPADATPPAAEPAPAEAEASTEPEPVAEVLDLFALAPRPEAEPRSPRAASPRPRKTREPAAAEEIGLFDEPE